MNRHEALTALLAAVRAAFDEGCEQGGDEATSYEWGTFPRQGRDEAFADFMAEWNPDSAPIRALIAETKP